MREAKAKTIELEKRIMDVLNNESTVNKVERWIE
jgi:hypothetical protein